MRGLAPLPAKRRRRQKWAIGFHHEFPERNFCRDLSHGRAVFESYNSRKRNEMIKGENFICLVKRATEAMKNTSQFTRVRAQHFQRVVPRVPLMNHNVEPKLDGEVKLLLKQTGLFRLECAVANLRFDFFIGFTSQSSHHLH